VTSVKFKVRNTTLVLQIAIEKHKKSLKIQKIVWPKSWFVKEQTNIMTTRN